MPCVGGLLLAKELEAFSQVLDADKKQRPLTAIVGGAKISDKIKVIENLIDQSDTVMCIGGMAYTFLKVAQLAPRHSRHGRHGRHSRHSRLDHRSLTARTLSAHALLAARPAVIQPPPPPSFQPPCIYFRVLALGRWRSACRLASHSSTRRAPTSSLC